MKTLFWYTLKIWLIAALPPALLVYWFYGAMAPGTSRIDLWMMAFSALLYMSPAALFAAYCAKKIRSADMPVYQRKAMIWFCNVMGLVMMTIVLSRSESGFATMAVMYVSSTMAIWMVKAPSAPQAPVQQPLHGRYVTLRPDNESNAWRGMVVSGVHTLPIHLRFDRSAPYPQLECHSLEKEDIFSLIADYVPVKVSACLPGKTDPLFSAILEIDHSLN